MRVGPMEPVVTNGLRKDTQSSSFPARSHGHT